MVNENGVCLKCLPGWEPSGMRVDGNYSLCIKKVCDKPNEVWNEESEECMSCGYWYEPDPKKLKCVTNEQIYMDSELNFSELVKGSKADFGHDGDMKTYVETI